MTKSDSYINFITDCLKSGDVEYVKVSSQFCTKFHKTQRTFASYWKKANEAYKIEQEQINKLKSDEYIKSELEAVKTQILTKQEKREYLRKVVHGEVSFEKFIIVKGEPKKVQVKADAVEILKAIDLDNKMAGDDAPSKSEITIQKPLVINWSGEQIDNK